MNKKYSRYERMFLKIVQSYVEVFPEHAFKIKFDNTAFPKIGTGKQIVVSIKNSKHVFKRIFTEGSLGLGE
ncbi:MAG: hypothetical protein ACI8Y7_001094, partial [Candidatus Woesearchaeota archaeon]